MPSRMLRKSILAFRRARSTLQSCQDAGLWLSSASCSEQSGNQLALFCDSIRDLRPRELPLEPADSGDTGTSRGMNLGGGERSSPIQCYGMPCLSLQSNCKQKERRNFNTQQTFSASVWHNHSHPFSTSANPQAPVQRQRPEGVKHIIAVASGKGGVGKSTTAVNLAAALVHFVGLRVGLLDADVYGPSIPRLLNLHGRPHMVAGPGGRQCMAGMQAYGLTCMSMGFLMAEDAAAVWRGPMVMSALEQMLYGTMWGPLDVLVVDMPPGTGDAQLTLAQRAALSGAVIVSTPQDLALLDARRGAVMFGKVNVPILGLIENMSYFLCPSCGERAEIFSHGGARKTAEEMGMDFLGEIPLQLRIRQLSDQGRPVCVADPTSEVAMVYQKIAMTIKDKLFDGSKEPLVRPPPTIVQD